jgi:hypothetical protein
VITIAVKQLTGSDNERAGLAFHKSGEGRFEVAIAVDAHDRKLPPEHTRRRLNLEKFVWSSREKMAK